MNNKFKGWDTVASHLIAYADEQQAIEADAATRGVARLNAGQQDSLIALAERLPKNGVVIADEVGMGKTRIAVEVARAVIAAGGRVAILVPPGLGYQWRDELRDGKVNSVPIVRSLRNYFDAWETGAPWFTLPVVVISHAFSRWSLGENSEPWRWGLLPAVYALWQTQTLYARSPHGYGPLAKKLGPDAAKAARGYGRRTNALKPNVTKVANSIYQAVSKDSRSTAYRLCSQMVELTPWPSAREASEYGSTSELRQQLECVVGLGLGIFDLVIVDEAHKSRGDESGLSRLLDSVIQRSPSARVIAMTATPVELEVSQWKNTLFRIGVDIEKPPAMRDAINAYAVAVKQVRLSPINSETRHAYQNAAANFEEQLSPFLLRRDKREDPAVMAFRDHTRLAANNYRRVEEIAVETLTLTPAWRQAVCAAEALSLVSQQGESSGAKRLRLTIGNGHGIANVLNPISKIDPSDTLQEQSEDDEQAEGTKNMDSEQDVTSADIQDPKRLQRTAWWHKSMAQAFVGRDGGLFDHPAILACVHAIETATANGEKVLVFGRFTQPLRALVHLLNAREMLRCLQTGRPWPQAKVHEGGQSDDAKEDERPAVEAACRQLGYGASQADIDRLLSRQYQDLENLRERWRTGLLGKLAGGLKLNMGAIQSDSMSKVQQIFSAFQESTQSETTADTNNGLALVGRAMLESIPDPEQATPDQIAEAFEQLINALTDRDEGDQDGDGKLSETEAEHLWSTIEARLKDEYNRTQGSFARLMFGKTEPNTRRLLQLAFNRPNSFPKVLVAQSMVGREGLNLHKACSTVILLHHEWNPGIVEQQIGRIDRVGSHWSKQLEAAIENKTAPDQFPRITVRPVIFKGTYDEHHWQVLRERWDDLRAQLHGVVIPPRLYINDPELRKLADELEAVAPNFSPTNKWQKTSGC
jgi:hypothetical protein